MKKISFNIITLLALSMMLASCDMVGGIFKAGFYAAIIALVLVVVLAYWLMNKFRRKRKY